MTDAADRAALIREGRARGESWESVSLGLGYTNAAGAFNWAKKHMDMGELVGRPKSSWTDTDVAALCSLYERGVTIHSIARQLGRPMGTVAHRVVALVADGRLRGRQARTKVVTEDRIASMRVRKERRDQSSAWTKRRCMTCRRPFRSQHIGHRICDRCKCGDSHAFGVTHSVVGVGLR